MYFSIPIRSVVKVYQTEGLLSVIRRSFVFIGKKVFSYETYYLLEQSVQDLELHHGKHVPVMPGSTTKLVTSNLQADELAREYEDFRPYHISAHQMLDAGATVLCVYIGKEFANMGWFATTDSAKKTFNDIPYHVDFDNKEACLGGSYTTPKYRRQGMRIYGNRFRNKALKELGIVTRKMAVRTNNIIGLKASNATPGHRVYARAHCIRFLAFTFWKEIPMGIPLQDIVGSKPD